MKKFKFICVECNTEIQPEKLMNIHINDVVYIGCRCPKCKDYTPVRIERIIEKSKLKTINQEAKEK